MAAVWMQSARGCTGWDSGADLSEVQGARVPPVAILRACTRRAQVLPDGCRNAASSLSAGSRALGCTGRGAQALQAAPGAW